ncbi:MAG TPA: radical SAM protein [Deltaproteobacteria bacterium]|nr:radical SAM protein [Deltaproteobacteria bacterium]
MTRRRPARSVTPADEGTPIYAVWEITLRCDQACAHCGSRAVRARPDELSTAELLEVAAKLVAMGSREVTLIGGEAYLREDVYELIAYLHRQGVRVTMQTGGKGLDLHRCERLVGAGLDAIGVSVDGPAEVHDVLRDNRGSHTAALAALDNARAAGLVTSVNTQINRLSWRFLPDVYEALQARGVRAWRGQLTVPMGRAADRPHWLLEPWRIIEVIDTLAELQRDAVERARAAGRPLEAAMNIALGNNLGYFGPHEELLRSHPGGDSAHWSGCSAGRFTIGIESDGTVKACPSLPTHPYTGGNLRDIPLEEIWQAPELTFARDRTTEELWGFCAGCYYAEICKAGCSWTSHTTLGRRGNMPWCYHRASKLKEQGLRERLIPAQAPPGVPYDFGRLELIEEPWPEEGEPG